jgi:hypothetical protein
MQERRHKMIYPFETWFLTAIGVYLFVFGLIALYFEYRNGRRDNMNSKEKQDKCKCLKGEDPWGRPYECKCATEVDKKKKGEDPWGNKY